MNRFVDRATITVQAGHGGKGCQSHYKDRWSRFPVPDGGDGGDGGNVVVKVNPQLMTLLDFQTRRHFRADSGTHASSNKKHGARGKDCIIQVPPGTLVWDEENKLLLRELLKPGESVVVAKGGLGGVGNALQHKQTARSRMPAYMRFNPDRMEGFPGEQKKLYLELKVIADVGIIGMPNAGKSTFLKAISETKQKIGAFPFTTLRPVLGSVDLSIDASIVMVDVPGLIEGAHEGRGLGLDFLRHVERARVLVHLVDMAGQDDRDPLEDLRVLSAELEQYSKAVAEKPRVLVANKMDCPEAEENLKKFKAVVGDDVIAISAKEEEGIEQLLERIEEVLETLNHE